jgi:L-fuculose-phosphate aldolase
MSQWQEGKKIVLETAKKMLAMGLVSGTEGNVSLRLPPEGGRELLVITPRKHYELFDVDDMQILDFEGNHVEGDLPPSIEAPIHIGIYKGRKNVNAVVHTHSVFASTAAAAGLDIPVIMDEQASVLGGEIRLSKYALPGSQDLMKNAVKALEGRSAAILQNHGMVGIGRTMPEALNACVLTEKMAMIYLRTLAIGKLTPIPAEAVEVGKSFYESL